MIVCATMMITNRGERNFQSLIQRGRDSMERGEGVALIVGVFESSYIQPLLEAMLEALTSGKHQRLGDAVLAAQEDYAETGAFPELLAIYHLFGDPALLMR